MIILVFPFHVSSRRTGQHVPERVSSPTSDGGKHRVKRTVAPPFPLSLPLPLPLPSPLPSPFPLLFCPSPFPSPFFPSLLSFSPLPPSPSPFPLAFGVSRDDLYYRCQGLQPKDQAKDFKFNLDERLQRVNPPYPLASRGVLAQSDTST